MFPDSEGTRIDAQPPRNVGTLETVDVEHAQEIAIVFRHLLERGADFLATRFVDERDERIGFVAARGLHSAAKSQKCAFLPARRSAVVEADVPCCLKNECRKRFHILDTLFTERLQRTPQRFLRHIFGRCPIAQAPRGEDAQTLPEAVGKLDRDVVGHARDRVRSHDF